MMLTQPHNIFKSHQDFVRVTLVRLVNIVGLIGVNI